MANMSKIAKNIWEKHRDKWFDSERKFKEKMENEGFEIITHRKGYPDFTLRKDGQIIFREIKKGNDSLSPVQKMVMLTLKNAGFNVEVLRYNELSDEFIKDDCWYD